MKEEDKETFAPVKSEMYQLLVTAFSYEQKLAELPRRMQQASRIFLLEETTALRHLSNGIILHLCNLDDDSSKWSLRSLRKTLAKERCAQEALLRSNELLKEYRAGLNRLKVKHRNEFIAHRNREEYPDPLDFSDYSAEFKTLIRKALGIVECLWGSEMTFGFRLGSVEPQIDFKILLNLLGAEQSVATEDGLRLNGGVGRQDRS